jgi:outer membrane receptor protein involved in Fe transport
LQRYVNNPAVPPPGERQKRMFFYGQDTWRVNPKLTLNIGLRWEIYFPETVSAKGGGGFANITDLGGTGAVRVADVGGIGSNGNVANDWHAFAPRFGIAYQATPKTVVRMGYGRSYDIGVFGSNFGHTVTQNLPVLLKQNYDVTNFPADFPGEVANRSPLFTLDAGPNSVAGIDPANAFPEIPSNGIIPFNTLGGTISGLHIRPPKQALPRVDAYNATVQHQITSSISLEVAYVGSKGTHGFTGNNPNYDVNPVSMALYGTGVDQNLRRPLCRNGTGICFDLGNYYGNDAASTYNAFEVKVEKRFAKGLQFITHYTYSHADGYDSNYYAIDHKIAWGPVDFNRNHVWVFSPVYELPFGKGKQFMGDASRVMDYLVGGWQVSNNTTWGSGLPWTPGFSQCGTEQDVSVCRPDRGTGSFHTGVSGHIDPVNHNLTFFTPLPDITTHPGEAFADPGNGHLGNVQRNSLHGPRAFTSDLSLVKKFPVYERFNIQFRTDIFNLFNHAVYANPNTTIDFKDGGTPGTNDGKITSLQFGYPMRQIQFALRFDF